MSWLTDLVHHILAKKAIRETEKFAAKCRRPKETQRELLLAQIQRERDTGFGRDHRFSDVRTLEDFRRNVPVTDYDYHAPYIERVKNGDVEALLHKQEVLMFALTSGTSDARKFLPVTKRSIAAHKRGWYLWGLQTFAAYPELLMTGKMTLSSDPDEFRTSANVPCGSLSGLTAKLQNIFVRNTCWMPPEASGISDTVAKQYLAWRFALMRDVTMWMTVNPSTHLNLARFGERHAEQLIRDVYNGGVSGGFDVPPDVLKVRKNFLKPNPARARQLERVLSKEGRFLPRHIWPNIGLIACWLGGSVGVYVKQFPEYFGDVPHRDIGLIASECRMTVPIHDGTPSGILEISSTFFEFIPVEEIDSPHPTVLESHELQEGGEYFVLLTTAGGLYRYNIHDVVRCTGWWENTPLLEFLHKGKHISNLTGEKLSESQVCGAVETSAAELGIIPKTYSMGVIFDEETPFYGLFLEEDDANHGKAQELAARVDGKLKASNCEYEAKRDSGRLGPVALRVMPNGSWDRFDADRLRKKGGSAEQYKHPCLLVDLAEVQTLPLVDGGVLA
jgi:hypothetical protein